MITRRAVGQTASAVALWFAGRAGLAQGPTSVTDRAQCRSCVIELRTVLEIGSPNDSVFYSLDRIAIARSADGRFFVGPRAPQRQREYLIDVFGSDGRRVRSIARFGDGPNEIDGLQTFAMDRRDGLVLIGRNKIAFMATTGELERQIPRLPGTVQTPPALHARTFVVASPAMLDGVVRPFQLVSAATGQIIRSFGELDVVGELALEVATRGSVAEASGGGVWTAVVNKYEVQRWDSAGKLRQRLVRDVEWFRPWLSRPSGSPNRLPFLMGLTEDRRGLLWTCTFVPTIRARNDSGRVTAAGFLNSVFDTVIEVIDPRTSKLIASQRLPGAIRGFFGGDLLVRSWDGSNGVPYVAVLQAFLNYP